MTDMAGSEQLLADRFAALAIPDAGDWLDVRRRARRMRVRRAALAAVAILAAAFLVAPALGLHRVVVDWLSTEKAPESTQLDFLRLDVIARPGQSFGVIPNSARKVMTVQFEGKTHVLAVAPTKSGGFCWQWSNLTGSCVRDRNEVGLEGNDPRDVNPFALGAGFMADEDGTVSLVDGRLLDAGIERLSLEYEDGLSTDIPFVWVSPPIDAGFYFFEVPDDRRARGRRAHALVATDSQRDIVARMIFPIPRPEDVDRTVRLPDGELTQLPANALVERARRLIDFRAESGARVTLWLVPRDGDPPCFVHDRGRSCPPRGFLGRFDVPLGAGLSGGRPVLFEGHVGKNVALVELVYEDGAVEHVKPVEHYVLAEIGSAHYGRGHRLISAVARSADGRILERKAFAPEAHGVYPCEKPVDLGHGVTGCP